MIGWETVIPNERSVLELLERSRNASEDQKEQLIDAWDGHMERLGVEGGWEAGNEKTAHRWDSAMLVMSAVRAMPARQREAVNEALTDIHELASEEYVGFLDDEGENDALCAAVLAVVSRSSLSLINFNNLVSPWESVMGMVPNIENSRNFL